jgi:hypothetical protein
MFFQNTFKHCDIEWSQSYLTPPLPDCELLKFLADEHERHPEPHFQGCTHYQDVSTVVWRGAWVASPLFSIPRRPTERE